MCEIAVRWIQVFFKLLFQGFPEDDFSSQQQSWT